MGNEQLKASWDEPSSILVLHKTDPTRLQNMTNQLSDKIISITDINERILEARHNGGSGYQGYQRDNNSRNNRNWQEGGGNRNYHRNDSRTTGYSNHQGGNRGNYNRNRDNNAGGSTGGGSGSYNRSTYYKR